MKQALASSLLPSLPDVTLVAVTSVAIPATIEALRRSTEQARFAEVLFLCDRAPPRDYPGMTWRPIGRLASKADYSRFMLRDLAPHVATSHALCIQWDGFVTDGHAWEPRFLDYDYIGALWPHFRDGHDVGNGGFSLRSKRLLEACSDLPLDGSEPEDIIIGRSCRPRLEELGLRFAPPSVARQFAYERTPPSGREFGFHGAFNLVDHVSRADALGIFRSLEPGMLARNERSELFRWSLLHGRLRLALTMLSRMM